MNFGATVGEIRYRTYLKIWLFVDQKQHTGYTRYRGISGVNSEKKNTSLMDARSDQIGSCTSGIHNHNNAKHFAKSNVDSSELLLMLEQSWEPKARGGTAFQA